MTLHVANNKNTPHVTCPGNKKPEVGTSTLCSFACERRLFGTRVQPLASHLLRTFLPLFEHEIRKARYIITLKPEHGRLLKRAPSASLLGTVMISHLFARLCSVSQSAGVLSFSDCSDSRHAQSLIFMSADSSNWSRRSPSSVLVGWVTASSEPCARHVFNVTHLKKKKVALASHFIEIK